jgi:hypothetical protein
VAQVIVLPGWGDLQHYKERDPTWVKLYRDILTTESWVLGTDASRLVQLACILLAARYRNATPFKFDMFRKVAHLDITERQFKESVEHLVTHKFVEIQGVVDPASTTLAECSSEKRREEKSRGEEIAPTELVPLKRDDPVARVFDHWKQVHNHPRAGLDKKRRKLIADRLKTYTEADLCLCISGYLNSPHHMGQNERATVYDSLEVFLRDASHVDAGIKFAAEPPRTDLSSTSRRNVAAVSDWVPPEVRNATG